MSKSLKDYPISFGYLETATINGKPYVHRGSDRAAPTGTKIIIGNTTIGEVGNTGLSTGSHCHLQAGKDEWAQNTINPDPYWFKEGTVHNTGYGDQWGNYICIKVGDVYVYYCHLSKINVSKGQKITKGDDMIPTRDLLNAIFYSFRGRKASDEEAKKYINKITYNNLIPVLNRGAERNKWITNAEKARDGKLVEPSKASRQSTIDYINKNLK